MLKQKTEDNVKVKGQCYFLSVTSRNSVTITSHESTRPSDVFLTSTMHLAFAKAADQTKTGIKIKDET